MQNFGISRGALAEVCRVLPSDTVILLKTALDTCVKTLCRAFLVPVLCNHGICSLYGTYRWSAKQHHLQTELEEEDRAALQRLSCIDSYRKVLACGHGAVMTVTIAISASTDPAMLVLSMTTGPMQWGGSRCLPGTQVQGLAFLVIRAWLLQHARWARPVMSRH